MQKNQMGGASSAYGGDEKRIQGFGRETSGKVRTRTGLSQMWDNIKIDLQEVKFWGIGLDRSGSGQGQVMGTCECGNEHLGSIKCEKFVDQLKTGWLLKNELALFSK